MPTPVMYIVTASALNLRAGPSTGASRLAAMPRDSIVTRLDEPALAAEWLKVEWSGRTGYAASRFLRPVSGAPAVPSPPAGEVEFPAVIPVQSRDRDLAKLHPKVRAAIVSTLEALKQKEIPFRVFEGFRAPERQNWLYAQGRTRPGAKVTRARAWESLHQYGLAADLVLFASDGWSWDDSGQRASWWREMQAEARRNGLEPLSFELPHVQLKGAEWRVLQQGRLPPDGDESWYDSLSLTAERWRRSGKSPAGPVVPVGERPEIPD